MPSDQPGVSLDAHAQFFQRLHNTPALTAKEETTLLAALAAGGKTARMARDRLVEALQPLVVSIAKRYVRQAEALELLDVVQEGTIGLLDALEHYDPAAASATFSTWAFPWIRGAILRALWRTEHLISLPPRKVRQLQQFDEFHAQFCIEQHTEPTLRQMADALGLSLAEARELVELRRQHDAVLSLDTVYGDGNQETTTLGDTLIAPSTVPSPLVTAFYHAWAQLPAKERLVMTLRLGLEDHEPMTQQEVADAVGVALCTVQLLDRRARLRLERALRIVGVLKPAERLALTA